MTRTGSYSHVFWLPFERGALFDLFAEPRCLDLLTPPWFRLRPVGDPPRKLGVGSEISYRLRWRGLPLGWTSIVTDWQRPGYLAYEQKEGPYLYFRHDHVFESTDGGTRIVDRVFFRSRGGRLVDRLIVRPDLERIFGYRERTVRALLKGLPSEDLPESLSTPLVEAVSCEPWAAS